MGPGLAVLADEQPLLPRLDLLLGKEEVGLVRTDLLDDLPEVLDQAADEVLRRGVVHLGGPAPEVLDHQVPDLAVAQLVAVHQVLDRPAATDPGVLQGAGHPGRDQSHAVQQRPGGGDASPGGLLAVQDERPGRDAAQVDAEDSQRVAQLEARFVLGFPADRMAFQPGAEFLQQRVAGNGPEPVGVLLGAGGAQGRQRRPDQPHAVRVARCHLEPSPPLRVVSREVPDRVPGLVEPCRLPALLPCAAGMLLEDLQKAAHPVPVVREGVPVPARECLADRDDDILGRGGRQLPGRTGRPRLRWRCLGDDPGGQRRLPGRHVRVVLCAVAPDPVGRGVHPNARADGLTCHRTPPQRRRGRNGLPSWPEPRAAGNARPACRAGLPARPACSGRWS